MKKLNNSITYVLVSCVAILIILVSGIVFIDKVNQETKKSTMRELQEITLQCSERVEHELQTKVLVLKLLANEIASHNMSAQNKLTVFSKYTSSNNAVNNKNDILDLDFLRIGYAGLDGIITYTDGLTLNIKNNNNFKKCINGESLILYDTTDPLKIDDKPRIIFMVPVLKSNENEVAGVLSGSCYLSQIPEYDLPSSFDHIGNTMITDNSGTIIVHSNKDYIGQNIFHLLKEDSNNSDRGNFENAIKNNESGTAKLKFSGEEYMLGYTGFNTIPDWNCITFVPVDDISIFSDEIKNSFSYMFFFFLIVVIAVCGYNVNNYLKNNKIIDNMMYLDNLTGGYNYKKFCIEAQKCMRANPNEKYVCCLLEVNDFLLIKNIHGNDIADKILQILWKSINDILPKNSIMARINTKYFAVFLICHEDNAIKLMLNKIIKENKNIKIDYVMYDIILHCGLYKFDNENILLDDALDKAKVALYKAKKGVNSLAYYDDSLLKQITDMDLGQYRRHK